MPYVRHHRRGSLTWSLAGGVVAAAIGLAACSSDGGSADDGAGESPGAGRETGRQDEGRRTPAPKKPPRLKEAPLIYEGKTLRVVTKPNKLIGEPGTRTEITLIRMETATSIADPEAMETYRPDETQQQFVCLQFKVRNTGSSGEFDTTTLQSGQWKGADGELRSLDPGIWARCDPLGMRSRELSSSPNPGPGEHVEGVALLVVPSDQPGTIQFSDPNDKPMLRLKTRAAE